MHFAFSQFSSFLWKGGIAPEALGMVNPEWQIQSGQEGEEALGSWGVSFLVHPKFWDPDP